jgi:4'-phosphopantetheinyl transferase
MEIIAVRLDFNKEEKPSSDIRDIFINSDLQQKISKLHRYEDRLRSLCGEMLLQVFCKQHWCLSPKEMVREVNRYGKPRFTKYPHYHYNISHSGEWVVAAFDNCPLGIDIEKIKRIDLEIAERFFASSEINAIRSKKELNEKTKLFYQLWTLKESYVKAVGEGLSIPLNSFSIDISNGNSINLQQSKLWRFMQYDFDSDYALAVCGQDPIFPMDIKQMEWRELQRDFYDIHNIELVVTSD